MNREARRDLLATMLGTAAGTGACALWARDHDQSLVVPMVCGALGGALGGFSLESIFEAIVFAVFGSISLVFLSSFHEHLVGRIVFSFAAGVVVGRIAGALVPRVMDFDSP